MPTRFFLLTCSGVRHLGYLPGLATELMSSMTVIVHAENCANHPGRWRYLEPFFLRKSLCGRKTCKKIITICSVINPCLDVLWRKGVYVFSFSIAHVGNHLKALTEMTLREERCGSRFLVTWTRKRAGGEVTATRTLQHLSAKVNECFKPHLRFALL